MRNNLAARLVEATIFGLRKKPSRLLTFAFGLLMVSSFGCQPEENEVKSYLTDSSSPPESVTEDKKSSSGPMHGSLAHAQLSMQRTPMVVTDAAPTHRRLVTLIRQGETVWFFKYTAPFDVVKKQEAGIEAFVKSISFKTGDPTWELPAGWEKGPKKPMRFATLLIPNGSKDDKKTELAISQLPQKSEWNEYLLSNVNRWLGQLQQANITADALKKIVRISKIEGLETTWLDLQGVPMSENAMRGAFAKTKTAEAVSEKSAAATKPKTKVKAPVIKARPAVKITAKPTQGEGWNYQLPTGWILEKPRTMRKATISVGEKKEIQLVVSAWDTAAKMMADPLANINRWRGQLGMSNITKAELTELVEEVSLADKKANYAALVPESGPQAMLVAMVLVENEMWFFKFTGKKEAVLLEANQFKAFLETVSLTK